MRSVDFVRRVLLCAVTLQTFAAVAEDHTVQLVVEQQGNVTNAYVAGDGTYASVVKDILVLREQPINDTSILDRIVGNFNDLPPPYYLEAARRLCLRDADAARDWLTLYSTRARYDALRCTDPSAIETVRSALFTLQIPECQAAMSETEELVQALIRTANRPDLLASRASPWWICSSGMGLLQQELAKATGETLPPPSVVKESAWIRPEGEWPAVAAEVLAQLQYSIEKHTSKK